MQVKGYEMLMNRLEKYKWGVIIQGPLYKRPESNNHYLIDEIILNLRNEFNDDCIVCLSTWTDEPVHCIKQIEGVLVVQSDIPSGKDWNNRRKQIWSTYNGLCKLSECSEIDVVIKLRTDQILNLKKMKRFLEAEFKKDDNERIYFPAGLKSVPFHLADYYWGGKFSSVRKFLENNLLLEAYVFHTAVEIDLVLKHMYMAENLNAKPFRSLILFFPVYQYPFVNVNTKFYNMNAKYWCSIRKKYFGLFPRGILGTMDWRNKRMDYQERPEFKMEMEFYEEWNNSAIIPRSITSIFVVPNTLTKILLFLESFEKFFRLHLKIGGIPKMRNLYAKINRHIYSRVTAKRGIVFSK